jgi:hypothetical protein
MRQRLAAGQGQTEHLEIAGADRGFDLDRRSLCGVPPCEKGVRCNIRRGAPTVRPLGVGRLDVSPSPDPASPAPPDRLGGPPARPGA